MLLGFVRICVPPVVPSGRYQTPPEPPETQNALPSEVVADRTLVLLNAVFRREEESTFPAALIRQTTRLMVPEVLEDTFAMPGEAA
jgi:hypothetical protein